MLGKFTGYNNVWIEITSALHGHGGEGWEYGQWLWSPSRSSNGQDIYSLMRQIQPGDLVLHFLENYWETSVAHRRFAGYSFAKDIYEESSVEPPLPGDWDDRESYYRVPLEGYTPLAQAVPLSTVFELYDDEIVREKIEDDPKYYPFALLNDGRINVVQGRYVSHCTERLYRILLEAAKVETVSVEATVEDEPHKMYREGRRYRSETYFFTRNPRLAEAAKQRADYRCEACGFDFFETYGDLGKHYLECHHLNPLSEMPEDEWDEEVMTTLDEVVALCANCHRMIHRRRPALALRELMEALGR